MSIQELYKIYLQHPRVITDTRRLQAGDLFFALRGPSFNGNSFAQAALDAGAAYAIVDDPALAGGERFIAVTDVLQTLQDLAKYHRRQLRCPVIAITGSNGKTTTKELVAAVLQKKYRTWYTEGNLNNHIGVPLTLLRIPVDAEMAIIEMGANHQKEIEGYCYVAEPTHGLITNCGKAHLEGFGGEEGVRRGKGELYTYLRTNGGTIFRSTNQAYLKDMAKGILEQVTYGSGPDAQVKAVPVMEDVFLSVKLTSSRFNGPTTILSTRLVGEYNFDNVMAAIAVGSFFYVPVEGIAEALAAYNPDNSRSQWMTRGSNRLILDAYNANPSSMKAAIENFAAMNLPERRLWLGGMKEMGTAESAEHQRIVALIRQTAWSEVILVGEEFRFAEEEFRWYPDSATAAESVRASPPTGAHILLKGSRGSRMEVMLEALPSE